jgi:uncharacterized DUF497 family protein
MIRFEFDSEKAVENQREHGVTFAEAQTVFYDENAMQYDDPDHSDTEERFLMLGLSERLRILVVSHTFRDADKVIRIISARKATKREQRAYGGKGR